MKTQFCLTQKIFRNKQQQHTKNYLKIRLLKLELKSLSTLSCADDGSTSTYTTCPGRKTRRRRRRRRRYRLTGVPSALTGGFKEGSWGSAAHDLSYFIHLVLLVLNSTTFTCTIRREKSNYE